MVCSCTISKTPNISNSIYVFGKLMSFRCKEEPLVFSVINTTINKNIFGTVVMLQPPVTTDLTDRLS
jgi:hypothetical protein